MEILILLASLATSIFLTGLVWYVQIVHYPLFAAVGKDGFLSYERLHIELTAWVVGPVMVVEAITALALVILRPAALSAPVAWSALALLGLVWLSTGLLQFPQHQILLHGFSPAAHARLVATNWVRTAAWTARSCILLGSVAIELGAG